MAFLRNLFGKKEESKPLDPASKELAAALALTAGVTQQQKAVSQAAANQDFQAMIRESTKGIDFANKFPELLPDFAVQMLYFYTMRATGYWATDKNSLALSDIEHALDLPAQNFVGNPKVSQMLDKLMQMQSQILAENK